MKMKILRNEIDWLSLAFNPGSKWLAATQKTEVFEKSVLEKDADGNEKVKKAELTRFLAPVLPVGEARGKTVLMKGTIEKYDFLVENEKLGRFYRNVSLVREWKSIIGSEGTDRETKFPTKLEFEGTDLSDKKRRTAIMKLARELISSGEARITHIDYAVDVGDADPIFFYNRLRSEKGKAKLDIDNKTKRLTGFGVRNSRGKFRCYDKKCELQDAGKTDAAPDYAKLMAYPGEVTRLEFAFKSEFCRRRDSMLLLDKIEAVFLRALHRTISIDVRKRKSNDPLKYLFQKVANEVPEDRHPNSNLVSLHARMKMAASRLKSAIRTLTDAELVAGFKSEVFADFSRDELKTITRLAKYAASKKSAEIDYIDIDLE